MAQVTLTGRWVGPDLTPRSGRVLATVVDHTRADGGSIIGSAVGHLDGTGAATLQVAAPATGTAAYVIRERLDDVGEHTYRITVSAGDTAIDLSTRPA